jgi:hypothetical protein
MIALIILAQAIEIAKIKKEDDNDKKNVSKNQPQALEDIFELKALCNFQGPLA